MKEDFLHYIWKFRQFKTQELKTVDGELVEILDPGVHNENAGPDFLDARLRIAGTLWAGNVEIHLTSSDWIKHGHQDDRAYDNVILHVVFGHDKSISQGGRKSIPTLELKDLIDFQSYRKYKAWLSSGKFIPCDRLLHTVPDIVKMSAVQSAAVRRLKEKSEDCLQHLNETKGDMEEAFYRIFMRSLGMKVNALPFEQLAKITPHSLVRKVSVSREQLESLFLGQSGFLYASDSHHPYVSELKANYSFLKHKFSLTPMPVTSWKLFRLRPQNFPQVRLAQAAAFFHSQPTVVSSLLELRHPERITDFFRTELRGDFWGNHYTLNSESAPKKKSFGDQFLKHLIINAVVPFVFALARYGKDENFRMLALEIMEELPSEKNSIIRRFDNSGLGSESALDSQGLLHLKKKYCDLKKCLNCKIGIHLIQHHAEVS